MTRDEAMRIIAIMATADGGCPCCVGGLIRQFDKAFPEFRDLLIVKQEDTIFGHKEEFFYPGEEALSIKLPW